MKKWPLSTISAVADVFDGPHATPKTIDHGAIFLGIDSLDHGRLNLSSTRHVTNEDFKKWTKRIKPEAGDIVFSYETRLGEVAIIPEGLVCCLGRRMALIRTDRSVLNEKFFLYYFMSPQFQEQIRKNTINGATVDRIPLKDFPSFKLELPPLDEQHTIASILGSLDDKIDLNRRTNETLEAMARALFRDWFVDFGPTRAKMAGEAPYLAPELWELFPDRLDDEGKPEGWRIASIDSLCRITSGKRPPNKETSPSDENPIPVYGGNGISWFTKDVLFNQPFLITGRVGTLGTVFRVNEKCWVSDNALCLFPKIDSYFEYLYFIVSGIDFQSLNSGSTQPLLTQSSLSSQECIFPAEEIITIFHTQISVWFEMQRQLEKESNTLSQLRDLLLPKLMSGEISIRDAEKMVEDAT